LAEGSAWDCRPDDNMKMNFIFMLTGPAASPRVAVKVKLDFIFRMARGL
jgi:hypothetical protein